MSSLALQRYICPKLNDIDVSEDSIRQAVKDMSSSSTTGPDGIPPHIYKDYIDQFVHPIVQIWRTSLDVGLLPEGIARALISPIHKGGVKSDPANYRPVALTNRLAKIFERVMRKAILNHLEAHNLMDPTHHRFRSGRSTITQLLLYLDIVLSKLEEGVEVDSIYLDFEKAFDKVDHSALLKKIHSINIGGKIAKWIEAFSKKRQQSISVEGQISDPAHVLSGVPQGSVLGPILFLILVIDINTNILRAALGSFADDIRLWHAIKTFCEENELQEAKHCLPPLGRPK